MTRSEAEEMFLAVIMTGESAVIEMTQKECQVFRVLIGRCMQEMERKNRALWLRARDFGVEYKEPYAIVRKLDANRYKMWKLDPKTGNMVPFVRAVEEEVLTKIDNAGKGVSDVTAEGT